MNCNRSQDLVHLAALDPCAVGWLSWRPFCSSGLLLARTRCVRATFSGYFALSSNPCHWLTPATSIIFIWKRIGNTGTRTGGCWVMSKDATSVQCSPPSKGLLYLPGTSTRSSTPPSSRRTASSRSWPTTRWTAKARGTVAPRAGRPRWDSNKG